MAEPSSSVSPALAEPGPRSSASDGAYKASPPQDHALIGVLREAVKSGSLSTDAILNATADAARVLSGADGTAVASRVGADVVCRARSGHLAPALGAPLDIQSGISGECMRTAATLVCQDADTDSRVDPEVCRALGIRSILVVPLRGRNGMQGVLESFSARTDAFGNEQVQWLQTLAEIVELAYERELRPAVVSGTQPVPNRAAVAPQPSSVDLAPFEKKPKSPWLYWVGGATAVLLLLAVFVIRLTWRQTGAEIAASEPTVKPSNSTETVSDPPALRVESYKPPAGVDGRELQHASGKRILQNAADVEPSETDSPRTKTASSNQATSPRILPTENGTITTNEPPPSVEMASAALPSELNRITTGSEKLPQFGAPVSQGVVEPVLLKQVSPNYPAQARMQRITGPVQLDAAISANGEVRNVKVVSGPALLAAAAADAVRQWRYAPATLNGKAIEMQKRITVVFHLP